MENAQQADTAAAAPSHISVVLVDFGGTGIKPGELEACAAALQIQMQRDYAKHWGIGHGVTVRVGMSPLDIGAKEYLGGAYENPDIAGAYGYHEIGPNGLPAFKWFPRLDENDGHPWTLTPSHEIGELLGDLFCNEGIQDARGRWWAKENFDPTERDSYEINGVKVSNFVTPQWYGAPGTRFDFMGLLDAPFTCTPGGYSQWYSEATGWQQEFASHRETGESIMPRAYRLAMLQSGAGRSGRRAKRGKAT